MSQLIKRKDHYSKKRVAMRRKTMKKQKRTMRRIEKEKRGG